MRVTKLIEHLRGKTAIDRDCAAMITASQKFAFNPGIVPVEILDGAAQYTRQLMANELFPMPFDVCVFEFGPGGLVAGDDGIPLLRDNDWLWVLAWKEALESEAAGWALYFRTFAQMAGMGAPYAIPSIGQLFTGEFDESGEHGYFRLVGIDREARSALKAGAENVRHGDHATRVLLQRIAHRDSDILSFVDKIVTDQDHLAQWSSHMMEPAFHWLLTVLGLMSTSAGVSVETVLPTKKFINTNRIRSGKPPLEFEHKVVCIDPALTRIPGMVALGGTHASPRIHWRRGHIRTLQDGRKTQVKPCIVGDKTRGTIIHDYVVKPPPVPTTDGNPA